MNRNKILQIFKSFEIDTHIGPEMLNAIADKIMDVRESKSKRPIVGTLEDSKQNFRQLSSSFQKVIEAMDEKLNKEKAEWFSNNSDCYADTHELNHDTEPPVLVEGPVIQALTLKAFLKYPH